MTLAQLVRVGLAAAFGTAAMVVSIPAASAAPPADPNAKGYIALCDRSGHQVTSGNVKDAPFAWKAVAPDFRPPAEYAGPGQNAILDIYQLRPNSESGDWSGDQLTAPSVYTAAPTTVATTKDESLADFIKAYPPMDDGLYQLRMYFAARQSTTYSITYPATYIRVSGQTWSVLGGGTVNCTAAKAQSMEVIDGVVAAQDSGGTAIGSGVLPLPTGAVQAEATSTTTAPTGSNGSNGSNNHTTSAVHHSSGGSNTVLIVVIVLVAVAGATGGAWWWLRRRAAI